MTGLEPATSGVTGRRSNQLSYTRIHLREAGWLGQPVPPVKRTQAPRCARVHLRACDLSGRVARVLPAAGWSTQAQKNLNPIIDAQLGGSLLISYGHKCVAGCHIYRQKAFANGATLYRTALENKRRGPAPRRGPRRARCRHRGAEASCLLIAEI